MHIYNLKFFSVKMSYELLKSFLLFVEFIQLIAFLSDNILFGIFYSSEKSLGKYLINTFDNSLSDNRSFSVCACVFSCGVKCLELWHSFSPIYTNFSSHIFYLFGQKFWQSATSVRGELLT